MVLDQTTSGKTQKIVNSIRSKSKVNTVWYIEIYADLLSTDSIEPFKNSTKQQEWPLKAGCHNGHSYCILTFAILY